MTPRDARMAGVRGRSAQPFRNTGRWAGLLGIPALLWVGLWASINTGPCTLAKAPDGLVGWAHYLRTLLPLAAFVFACIGWLGRQVVRPARGVPLPGPARLWVAYGLVGLVACLMTPGDPARAAYWSICYLSVFLTFCLWAYSIAFMNGECR